MTDRLGSQIEMLFDSAAPPLTLAELGRVRPSPQATRDLVPLLGGLGVVVLVVGLTFALSQGRPGPSEPDLACFQPPAEELEIENPVGITFEPNPVAAGATATVIVESPSMSRSPNRRPAAWASPRTGPVTRPASCTFSVRLPSSLGEIDGFPPPAIEV